MLEVGVEEVRQEVSGCEAPNNDRLLNGDGKLMCEQRGERSITGELFKELRKRVARNILHVLSEESVLNPFTSDPFVQLKMSLRAGTGGLSPNDPKDNMWGEKVEMGPARVDVKWAMATRKMHQHIRFTPMNFLLEKVSMAAKCSRMFHRALMVMLRRRRRNPVRV